MFFAVFFIFLASATSWASAQAKETLSVTTYGAVCNGVTDDTAKFQAAAKAAETSYAATKSPVTVTYSGNCVIAGSVSYGSGVHWRGNGLITVPVGKASPTFQAINADNVEWDHVDINFTKSFGGSNPFASGIGWFSAPPDSLAHHHVRVTNCRISNSAWGITIFSATNRQSLRDVEIANNTVTSPTAYSNWDGIHVAGAVSDIRIHDNTVTNRGDAAVALTSEFQNGVIYTLSGATIQNNIATEDRVGIDISGATNVNVLGNQVKATTPAPDSQNPAFRQIYYGRTYPVNIRTSDNHFESGKGASYTAKIDPAAGEATWPSLNSTFENNVVSGPNYPLYIRGNSITVTGNIFTLNGAWLYIDYDGTGRVATSDVIIGTNRWLGDAHVQVGGDPALIRNVSMAHQVVAGKITIANGGNLRILGK